MFWTGQLKIFLPTYPYLIDLGRGRGNKNYFKLGLVVYDVSDFWSMKEEHIYFFVLYLNCVIQVLSILNHELNRVITLLY